MRTGSRTFHAWTLIVLIAALPVVAGCLGTAQATAMDERSTAAEAAEDWAPDAQLAGIVGLEGQGWPSMFFSGYDGDREGYWAQADEDPEVGDGHCELWRYVFISPSHQATAYVIVVDKDGAIVHQEEVERDDDHRPIGTWEVDSDEAMDIAMEENQGLSEGTDKEHYGLVMVLQKEDDREHATWFIAGGGGDRTGGGGGMVVLDAVTGEVLHSGGGFQQNPYTR